MIDIPVGAVVRLADDDERPPTRGRVVAPTAEERDVLRPGDLASVFVEWPGYRRAEYVEDLVVVRAADA